MNNILPLLAVFSLALAAVFSFIAVAAGFGTRMNIWGFRTGFLLLKLAGYAELTIAAAALIGCILAYFRGSQSSLPFFVFSFVISLATFIVPFRMYLAVRSVPAIHDITTDTDNPPRFDVILGMRKDALNPTEYGGPEIAQLQKKAYPDIEPLMLKVPPEKTFERAFAEAKNQGWIIANADKHRWLIEATDTTFWFGFRDDIVIRITPHEQGSRIDIRSLSRVGRSDVGANAHRIRRYLTALKKGN